MKLSYQNFVPAQEPRLRGKWWAVNKIECYRPRKKERKKKTARETLERIVEDDNRARNSEKPNHYILAH